MLTSGDLGQGGVHRLVCHVEKQGFIIPRGLLTNDLMGRRGAYDRLVRKWTSWTGYRAVNLLHGTQESASGAGNFT